jgi:lysophospholipase L1-like esterase
MRLRLLCSLLVLATSHVVGAQGSLPAGPARKGPPEQHRLGTPKILAFGDSITEGITIRDDRTFEVTRGYPARLQALLAARYPGQAISVDNVGKGGELALGGAKRLEGLVREDHDLVIVLEGVNDLNNKVAPETVQAALRSMIATARRRDASVLLCTLTPVIADKVTKRYKGPRAEQIKPLNRLIETLAREEGVGLVDLASAFAPNPARYLCIDGLHPNEAGYRRIAEAVQRAIAARFEQGRHRTRSPGAGAAPLQVSRVAP